MRIFPLDESALTVEFGSGISPELNSKAIDLGKYFERNPFPGFVECVPAYSSTTIFYDVVSVRKHFSEFPTAFAAVSILIEQAMSRVSDRSNNETRLVKIPVSFDDAPDLELLCEFSGLSSGTVIEIFLERTYRVYMLGFLPGFAYMGEVDERIAAPRKQTPRLKVPKGSVGIAGGQTGIYPLESPGGWQIIGQTDIDLFTPKTETPCLLRPGDEVRFVRGT
jgi:inhibitor of KinA